MSAGDRGAEPARPLVDCQSLREATKGCRMLLLTATELEAAPLLDALAGTRRFVFVTKTLYVGEMAGERVALAVSGCDKVNTAITLTSLLQAMAEPPRLVLQAGIGGAFAGTRAAEGARLGDVVVATQEAYSDTGSSSPGGWIAAADLGLPIAEVDGVELGGVFPVEPGLVEWAFEVLSVAGLDAAPDAGGARSVPAVWQGACVTSSTVTGRDDEAQLLAERWGALVESMEGAAAAHVCALLGVPFLEVRGISNFVGDRDRDSWRVEEAVAAAGRAALALVSARVGEGGE